MNSDKSIISEEVMGTTEEIAGAGSRNCLKVTFCIGLIVIGSGIAYKYAIKPIYNKIKAKKNQREIDEDFVYHKEYESVKSDETE